MELKGLIPEVQQETHPGLPHWKYGTIENNKKIIDPLLHYGCFTLGFDRNDIINHVCEQLKNIKPEIAESAVPTGDTLRLNHASYELADRIYILSNGYRSFYALSGSDANEGAVLIDYCEGACDQVDDAILGGWVETNAVEDPSVFQLVPIVILATLCLVWGLFPGSMLIFIRSAAELLTGLGG